MQRMAANMNFLLGTVMLLFFCPAQSKMHATAPLNNLIDRIHNCSIMHDSPLIKPAFRGWPYTLQWKELESEFTANLLSEYDDYEPYADYSTTDTFLASQKTMITCVIWDLDTNILIYNASYDAESGSSASYRLPDMGENSSVNFEIILSIPSANACLETLIHINLTDLPNHTCEEAVRLSPQNSRHQYVGGVAAFSCLVPYSMTPKLTVGEDTTHQWLRDCSPLPSYTQPQQSKGLSITNVTYEHPGVYTCAVTHNKQTWYTVHHKLCVRPRRTKHRHSIKCSMDEVFAKMGSKAVLVCTGYLSNGDNNPLGLNVDWKMKPTHNSNLTRCENPTASHKETSLSENNPNVKCAYEMNKLPCFGHVPNVEERKVKTQTIKMELEIRNIKESDFGEYEVSLTSFSGTPVKATVALKLTQEQELIKVAVAIGISFGILVVLMIFAIVSYVTYKKRKSASLKRVKRSKSTDDTSTITDSI